MASQSSVTIARPYAKAAFNIALQASELLQWQAVLALLKVAVLCPSLAKLLNDPTIKPAAFSTLLCDLSSKSLSPAQQHFVQFLAEQRRLTVLPEVSALFDSYLDDHQRTCRAQIRCVSPLTDAQKQQLIDRLSAKFGRKVSINEQLDADLIGGCVIQLGDWSLDGSVRTKLQQMRQQVLGDCAFI